MNYNTKSRAVILVLLVLLLAGLLGIFTLRLMDTALTGGLSVYAPVEPPEPAPEPTPESMPAPTSEPAPEPKRGASSPLIPIAIAGGAALAVLVFRLKRKRNGEKEE